MADVGDPINELLPLWQAHQDARWPRSIGPHEGELMTLDTVIGGCINYFLQAEDGLDDQRAEILDSCLADLSGLLPDLTDEAAAYFERLRVLACLLLDAHRSRGC